MFILVNISFADEHFPFSAVISRGPVNVRSGANVNFDIVTKLSEGDKIVVLAKSYEWYKIELPSQSNAYIRADYIKEATDHLGEIAGSKVNIRSRPDSTASVLGQMSKGDIVKLIQKVNEWWQVEPPNGTVAWVHSSFVNVGDRPMEAMLRMPLKIEAIVPIVSKKIEIAPLYHAEGTLKLLTENVLSDVHYRIVSKGETVCYLKDAENLARFKDVMVSLEGIKGVSQGVSAPVIEVKKIEIIL